MAAHSSSAKARRRADSAAAKENARRAVLEIETAAAEEEEVELRRSELSRVYDMVLVEREDGLTEELFFEISRAWREVHETLLSPRANRRDPGVVEHQQWHGEWSREQNRVSFEEMDVTKSEVVSKEDFIDFHLDLLSHHDKHAFENVVRHITTTLEVRAHHLGLTENVEM